VFNTKFRYFQTKTESKTLEKTWTDVTSHTRFHFVHGTHSTRSFSSVSSRHWRLFSYIRVSPYIHGVMKKSEKDRVRRVGSLTSPCVHATRLVLTATRGLPTATLPGLSRTIVNILLLPWSNMSSAMMSTVTIYREKGKAFPLQAWRGPWGSRSLRLQNF
jgi:hypothetical protein